MNFLFILNTFLPNVGGVENATFEICKILLKKSHKVYVLTTSKSNFHPQNAKLTRSEDMDGVQIFRVRYATRLLSIPLKTLYLAKKFRINYVYVTDFRGVTALFLKKLLRIPYVYVLNGYNPICPRGILFHTQPCLGFELAKCIRKCQNMSFRFLFTLLMTKLLIMNADHIIAVSRKVKNAFLSYFGNIPIKLIYYGVDNNKFRPEKVQYSILPNRIREEDKKLLIFGRLIKERGVLPFLDTFEEISKQIDCILIIAGLGAEIPAIKKKVFSLGLQNKVIFVGILRDKELINVINAANIVILPILFPEPLSLVALEAMACEKPIISFKMGGVKELIVNNKTGFLIPNNDWELFADKIVYLLKDEDVSLTFGSAARQRVKECFNWNNFMSKFMQEIKIKP